MASTFPEKLVKELNDRIDELKRENERLRAQWIETNLENQILNLKLFTKG